MSNESQQYSLSTGLALFCAACGIFGGLGFMWAMLSLSNHTDWYFPIVGVWFLWKMTK